MKKLYVLMALILLCLCGCSQGEQTAVKPDTEQAEKTEENNTEENKTEEDKANDATDESQTDSVHARGQYSDVVLDRSKVEGKFAVYFIASDAHYTSYSYSQKGGESVLLIAPDGTTMLYDSHKPISTAYVVYSLQQLGVKKIDYYVNTHAHVDHMGGFSLIARHFDIGHVYLPGARELYENPESVGGSTAAMMQEIKEKQIPYSYLVEGDSFKFSPEIDVKVYNPPADMDFANVNPNEWSLTFKFTYKKSTVLLAGDLGNNEAKLGRASESEVVAKYGSELQADVSKCNHHGDGNVNGNTLAGSKEWVNTVNSKIYVACNSQFTDEKNYFTHTATGAEVYHTGLDGTVLVYTSGDGTYDVQLEIERNNPEYFGSTGAKNGHVKVK